MEQENHQYKPNVLHIGEIRAMSAMKPEGGYGGE